MNAVEDADEHNVVDVEEEVEEADMDDELKADEEENGNGDVTLFDGVDALCGDGYWLPSRSKAFV